MPKIRVGVWVGVFTMALLPALAQQGKAPQKAAVITAQTAQPPIKSDPGETQQKLMALLQVSPTLGDILSYDPNLLNDQQYITRYNPELAQFLEEHPEVGRNPQFYLFSDLRPKGHHDYEVLSPRAGFEERHPPDLHPGLHMLINDLGPFLIFACVSGVLVWLIRQLLQNRRWGRIFKMQSQVHGQLIERFGSSQELMGYMQTDAGKRFLEAAPIATEFDQKRLPNVVSRVLMSLQVGVILSMLGLGLLVVRRSARLDADLRVVLLTFAMISLMPGIGFILSAAVTWVVGKRLGLMNDQPAEVGDQDRSAL
jgi:hypothetical protein